MSNHFYGEPPADLGPIDLGDWHELMHYLYLPVRLPLRDGGRFGQDDPALPERLEFLREAVCLALSNALAVSSHLADPYVYVTARRGFAGPGNPLNRPGWHCDDFGGEDLNYIWSDRFPTRFLSASEGLISLSPDDQESMREMEHLAENYAFHGATGITVEDGPLGHLLRLSPYVIHNTPEVPAPGGMRSFFKISVSNHRYNLLGNSHNYLLDYDWPMFNRAALRNQPQGSNRDYVVEPQR